MHHDTSSIFAPTTKTAPVQVYIADAAQGSRALDIRLRDWLMNIEFRVKFRYQEVVSVDTCIYISSLY